MVQLLDVLLLAPNTLIRGSREKGSLYLTVIFITQLCLIIKLIPCYTKPMIQAQVVSYSILHKPATNDQAGCTHEYKTFRETIQPTNDKFDELHKVAYYVVRGCLKCHDKQYLDYHVEDK